TSRRWSRRAPTRSSPARRSSTSGRAWPRRSPPCARGWTGGSRGARPWRAAGEGRRRAPPRPARRRRARVARAVTAPVALAATLHDPHGSFLPLLRPALPDLARRYAGLAIVATDDTAGGVLDLLAGAGATVACRPPDLGMVGRHRLEAVRLAATLAPAAHLGDFDRLPHWWRHYPDELAAVLAQIATVDLRVPG